MSLAPSGSIPWRSVGALDSGALDSYGNDGALKAISGAGMGRAVGRIKILWSAPLVPTSDNPPVKRVRPLKLRFHPIRREKCDARTIRRNALLHALLLHCESQGFMV